MSNKGTILLRDKSERFSFRLDADTSRMLHAMSTEQGMVPSEWVRQTIRSSWSARQTGLRMVEKAVQNLIGADAARAARNENE